MQSGFALYYLNDKAGKHEAAFAALTHANNIMREEDPRDVEANQAQLMQLETTLTADFLAARKGQGYDKAGPVFHCRHAAVRDHAH